MIAHGISSQTGQKCGQCPPLPRPTTNQITTLIRTTPVNPPARFRSPCDWTCLSFCRSGNWPGAGVGERVLHHRGGLVGPDRRQVTYQRFQLAVLLRGVQLVEPRGELGLVQPAVREGVPQSPGDLLAVGLGEALVWLVLAGHVSSVPQPGSARRPPEPSQRTAADRESVGQWTESDAEFLQFGLAAVQRGQHPRALRRQREGVLGVGGGVPSSVTTVQSSSRVWFSCLPSVSIGSTASARPSISLGPLPALP